MGSTTEWTNPLSILGFATITIAIIAFILAFQHPFVSIKQVKRVDPVPQISTIGDRAY